MALLWVWLCCLSGIASASLIQASTPGKQSILQDSPLNVRDPSGVPGTIISYLGNGPRRTLQEINTSCVTQCDVQNTTCYIGCNSTPCRSGCSDNHTACLITCHFCGSLGNLASGTITYSNFDRGGSVATHTCNSGYVLQGGISTKTCDPSIDTWVDSAPRTCLGVLCAALGAPVYGSNDLASTPQPRYPTSATFRCATGRNLSSNPRVYCGWDGFWYKTNGSQPKDLFGQADMPTCDNINECVPTNPCSQTCTDTIGSYTCGCSAGYFLSGPNQCTGLPCQLLAPLVNGVWRYKFGTSVVDSNNYECKYPCNSSLVCNSGYVPYVSSQTCQSSLSWSGTSANMVCVGRPCSTTFPNTSTATYTVDIVSSWGAYPPVGRFQDTVTVTCNPGYKLQSGHASWTCQNTGLWDCGGPTCAMPVCVGLPCDKPPNYAKSSVNVTNGGNYPSNITYGCQPGYEQTGATGIYPCVLPGLNWANINPLCSGKACGVPPSSASSTPVSYTGTIFPADAFYQCNPGYFTAFALNITCGTDSKWQAIPPCYLRNITTVSPSILAGTGGTYPIDISGTFAAGPFSSPAPADALTSTVSSITYGPPSNELAYNCNLTTQSPILIKCTPQAGVGGNFNLVVKGTSSTSGPFTLRQVGAFSYPRPTMFNKINVTYNDGSFGVETAAFTLKSTVGGDILTITGTNFGTDPSRVFVTMGDTVDGRPPFICGVISVTNTALRCRVPYGDSGPHNFRVGTGINEVVGNGVPEGDSILWSAYSNITIRYPTGPVIETVRGCTVNTTLGTSSCPTVGGTNITITGSGFLGGANTTADKPVITVSGEFCTYISHTASTIVCSIPSGAGLNQLVVVATAQGLAQRTLLSYKAGTVDSVTGCVGGLLKNCEREGGDTITLFGNNFGSCCASVIVGDIPCTAVRHDDATPHAKLTCILDSDKGLDKSIILQQNRGQVTYVQNFGVSFRECQPGTYDNPAPSVVCSACGPGKYTDVVSMTSCIDCEVGNFQPTTGQSGCVQAERARYVDVRGSDRSFLCPSGTFSTDVGRAFCTPCEAGTYASQVGNSVCQTCAVGSYQNTFGQSSCIPCPAGKFADSPGRFGCSICALGYVQPNQGTSACTACYRGKFSASTIACVDCIVGRYSNRDGLAACESCQRGFYQDAVGKTKCEDCIPGKFQQNLATTTCDLCPMGKFQDRYQAGACQSCAAGTASNVSGSVLCPACPPGLYSPRDGESVCTPCELGKLAADAAQITCLDCKKGYIGPGRGLTVCAACGAGTIAANDGSVSCSQCSPGFYSPTTGQSSCTACDLGFAANTSGASFCMSCLPGYFAPGTAGTTCIACIPGTYSETLQSFECKQCDVGRASNVLALPTNCPICPPGTYTSVDAAILCTPCSLGRFFGTAGSSLCSECFPGTFTNVTGTTRCSQCELGRYSNVEGLYVCINCKPGSFSSYEGSTICVACDPGTYAAKDALSVCINCAQGKYAENSGQSACLDCEVGKSSNNPLTCTYCVPGKYASTEGLSTCTDCSPGRFAQTGGQSSCPECATGKFLATPGEVYCPDCERGTYANFTGQSKCNECVPGRAAQDLGLALCRDCEPGKAAEAPRAPLCAYCELGFSQNLTGATSCVRCRAGTFSDKLGMAECETCARGKATGGINTRSVCGQCEPGKYANNTGQGECDACVVGRYMSTAGNAECLDCERGTFAATQGTPLCTPCAPGRHNNETAAIACEFCEEGTEASGLASAICEACQPGKFATGGASRCLDCLSGKINIMFGRSTCSDCNPGSYCPEEGGTTCSPCLPGRHANSPGQSFCASCLPGKFSNQSSAIECTSCPPGRYQEGTMSTECFDCGIGTASPGGQAKCDDCPSQTAQPYKAQPSCLRCHPLSKQSELKDECVCNTGTFAPPRNGPTESLLPCEPCPRGGDCSVKGTTFANIGSGYGFWRQDASALVFYQCQMPDYCPGGNVSTCAGHRTGALCGFCLPGFAASGAGGLGECSECVSEASSAATVVAISITAIVVIFILYYIVLYSDRKLLSRLKERQKAKTTELKQDYEQIDSSAFDNFEEGIEKLTNRANQERLRPNPVYKLKIVLGFFQIMSNLAFGVSFGWPTLYRKFLMIFNIINMDFFPWGSMSCLATMTYKSKLIVITMTPVGLFVLLICLYVLPKLYRDRRDMSDNDDLRNRRERSRIKFMKLCLFTVFAMFPFISSSVVKLWVCREIDSVYYLLADMGIRCYEEQWNDMLPMGVIFVLIYPVGIPLTFMGLLFHFRKRFKDPDVRIRLGFIYAAYTEENWWFELYDIASKLYLTSLVVFFPDGLRYGAVLIWLGIYILIVLLRKPYVTKGDDRLQLFCILEIYLLVSCAMILENQQMDEVLDTFLSLCLIFLTLLVAIGGFIMIARNLRKMYFERKRKQLIEKGMLANPDEELSLADETAEEQVLSWATKVRLRAVQLPKKLVAPPAPPPRVKPARPPRKVVQEQTSVTHAHVAPARYGGRVLAAVANIEASQAAANAWQTSSPKGLSKSESTMNISKSGSTMNLNKPEATQATIADPFAPAPGETRELPVQKPVRSAVVTASKPFKLPIPKPAEAKYPELKPSGLKAGNDEAKSTQTASSKTETPAKPARVAKVEPNETESSSVSTAKPFKPQKRTSDAASSSSPTRASKSDLESQATVRDKQAEQSSPRESQSESKELPKQKPKGPPPKSARDSRAILSQVSALPQVSDEAAVLSSEPSAQTQPRPPKPAKLARQARES